MRLSFIIGAACWWISCVQPAVCGGEAATASEARTDWQYFSIDVHPLVKHYQRSQVFSDLNDPEPSFYRQDTSPHLFVPAPGEAYLLEPENRNADFKGYRILGRKPAGESLTGQFYALRRDTETPRQRVLVRFEFSTDRADLGQRYEEGFLRAKGRHYQRLWSEGMAGAALFRHMAVSTLDRVDEQAVSRGPSWPLRTRRDVDQTIGLMSGGRAISENLQLDNQLQLPASGTGNWVPLKDVRGVEVREIDWDDFLTDEPTRLDPLAKWIPHDQHAAFLPSFQLLQQVLDRGTQLSRPLTLWFEPQGVHTDVIGQYQNQLALPLDQLTRQIGKALIDQIAITGSDPYFRTGTDIAVLMRTEQPAVLYSAVRLKIEAEVAARPDVQQTDHTVGSYAVRQYGSDDRSTSCFLVTFKDVVIVANSMHQVRRALRCADGSERAMHDLAEYRFFRQRYSLDRSPRAGLLVVTDATIRRWCGPKWRVSAARRTLARATISEVTMQHADALVGGELADRRIVDSPPGTPDVGTLLVSNAGVYSPRFGTLEFQTPIAELDIQAITAEESKLYQDWRRRYERRWRRNFDPIALQFFCDKHSLTADLSVIPLMGGTDYRPLIQLAGSKHLSPDAGDPHRQMLGSLTIAIDPESPLLQMLRSIVSNGGNGVDLLGWIDDSVTLYFDRDSHWLSALRERSPWDTAPEKVWREAPVAMFIPSKDNLRMTAFMIAVRAAVQRFAPNTFQWQSAEYHGYEYVVGNVRRNLSESRNGDDREPGIYYVTTGEGLTISFSRKLIQRVIERQLQSPATQAVEGTGGNAFAFQPQLAMQTTGEGVQAVARFNYRSGLYRMNRIAWSNLPILNELRRRYPNRDPKDVFRRLFGQVIVEPTGGRYVWDEELGSYVSSLHGFHLNPQPGPPWVSVLAPADQISTAIVFQDDGLRAGFKWTSKRDSESR